MSTALQSEERAFESLYRLNRSPVYAYALSRVHHPSDAEDITQTTFMNAYCALHRGVAPRDDLQWLLAIARNVCRDRFRDAKRRPKEEPLAEWMRLIQPDEPEFAVKDVVRELAALEPRQRQIIVMREFEGRSYAEISEQLGVSEAAVQTLLVRARRSLRDELRLGITCAHARRLALRNMNGVALLEERRALKRHLRRCAECATFVGQRPRTPIGQFVWLVTMPYRKLWSIIVGTSAIPSASTTAGGAGAAAMKLIAAAAIGTATAGVTAHELGTTIPEQTRPAPATHEFAPSSKHIAPVAHPVFAPRAVTYTTPATTPSPAAGTTRHTVKAHDAVPAVSLLPPAVQPSVPAAVAPSTPSAPAAPTPTEQPSVDHASAAVTQEAPPATAASAPDDTASSPAPADSTTPDAAAPATAPPDEAATTSTPDTTPPPGPSQGTPQGTPQTGPGQSNGNHTGVGQGGTPPGQAAKADSAHGKA